MAQKKTVIYVCDRCKSEHEKPLPGQMKVMISSKKWANWDLCAYCAEGLGDFLNDGAPEDDEDLD